MLERWNRDTRLIVAARGLRSFSYGLLSVLLGVALSNAGFSPAAIGALLTVSLAGDFVSTYLVGVMADAWGRRRTLIGLALLMAATGAVFGLSHNYPLLIAAGFFGTLGVSASETAPFLPLEQAMLAEIGDASRRTERFAHYNLVASVCLALGALTAGLPDVLVHLGIARGDGIRLMFGLYVLAALLVSIVVTRLGQEVEPSAMKARPSLPWKARMLPALGSSRRIILTLSALLSLDAFAGGLIVQSLMALYFHLRFGVSLGSLAVLFLGANTFSALSYLAAVPLARRFGLLNTMVFTHLPSNILLACIPLLPSFPLAALLLLVRQSLSQMDVPTRQAYTMELVRPEERTAAASVTSLARSAGSAGSPVLGGMLLQGPLLALGLPFVACGLLKIVYDLTLWSIFKRVPVPEQR
ncbi:MAG TPA: MFS transporter [Chloroflexi bacterium]|nr:MFS transporter [Chloroflexota bacterium]